VVSFFEKPNNSLMTDDWPIVVLFCESLDPFFFEINAKKQLSLCEGDFFIGFWKTMFVENLLRLSLADSPILSPVALKSYVRIFTFSNDIESALRDGVSMIPARIHS
jgi:hypothetical protein